MEDAQVDKLAEFMLVAGKLCAGGQKLSSTIEKMQRRGLVAQEYMAKDIDAALAEWMEVELQYHQLCSDLWTEPERKVQRPGWSPEKVDDVVKAMREGRE